jgi:hypothetical protein
MLYTTARTNARMLASDPNGDVPDADVLALFQETYETYWESYLRDRLALQSGFVTFAANGYVAEASVEVRDVQSLVPSVGLPVSTTGAHTKPIERDDYESVVQDTEMNPTHSPLAVPLRWGIRTKNDNSKPVVAIYPASSGATFAAWVYPLLNTLSTTPGTGDLQGTTKDGYSVARLVACQIMGLNGEDPADIEGVFKLLDQQVQDKFKGMRWRTQPRDAEDKEQ